MRGRTALRSAARRSRRKRSGPSSRSTGRSAPGKCDFLQYRGFSKDHIPVLWAVPGPDFDTRKNDPQETAFHERRGNPPRLPRLLPRARAHRRAVQLAGAGQRPDAAVHQRGHGAVQGRVPRQGPARLRARGVAPALRARRRQAQRPRERGLHGAPPHVLRDARQLLVRRLLQARRDPLRLGLPHRHAEARPGRASGSRSTSDDDEAASIWIERDRRAGGARHRAWARSRQLLGDGRHRPLRPLHRDLLRPRRARSRAARRARPTRTATATSRSGTWCSCSSSARPTAR